MRASFLLAAVAATALQASSQGRWLATSHDFGVIPEDGGIVYCDFCLVNEGTEPLAIFDVRANCGCTRPDYSTDPVEPGDTAVIHVGFNPAGRPGQFAKRVSVDCNVAPLRSSLTISGTVVGSDATLRTRFPIGIGPARLRADRINYGKILRGETKGMYLECINASPDSLRPRVEDAPGYIHAIIDPAVVPPGERFTIATVVNSNKINAWGNTSGRMLFYPDASATEPIEITTQMNIAEDFSRLTPKQLLEAPVISLSDIAVDLGRIPSTGKAKGSFTITNAGKSPLIIRSVSVSHPDGISVKLPTSTIKPGKTAKAEVTVDPSKFVRLINARIDIVSNAPGQPESTIRVVAELTD